MGLQEVALWRTGSPSLAPLLGAGNSASTVRYDFLDLLLTELNVRPDRYEAVVIQEEFDLEAPADENEIAGDGPNPYIANAELNVRLTMRDVILERVDAGVSVSNAQGGHFQNLLVLPVLGIPIAVTRGWVEVDARVRGTNRFHFVKRSHLEAFDPAAYHPSVRALQASGRARRVRRAHDRGSPRRPRRRPELR